MYLLHEIIQLLIHSHWNIGQPIYLESCHQKLNLQRYGLGTFIWRSLFRSKDEDFSNKERKAKIISAVNYIIK